MKKNESYKKLIEYLKKDNKLDQKQKRVLMSYASRLLKYNVNSVENESTEDIYKAIKEINRSLKNSNNTSIIIDRLNDEMDILERINEYKELTPEEKFEILYKLEKLYIDCDIPLRKKSSLTHSLVNRNKDVKNEYKRYK